jgi:hypothetical protein
MKRLILTVLFAAAFCIPAQTADIMPGLGYKITVLRVEQQSESDTLRGQMLQTGVIPEASIEFGKGDTDGFGLGLRIGGSQFNFSKQLVDLNFSDNGTVQATIAETFDLGTKVSGSYRYAAVPLFYRYELSKNNHLGLKGILAEIFYGTSTTEINGDIYLTQNCSATSSVSKDYISQVEKVIPLIQSQCEKARLQSNKSSALQGAQAEVQGDNFIFLIRGLSPSLVDNSDGKEKLVRYSELSLILNYRF